MMLSDPALDALLKRLHLANTRRAWRELARRAEQEAWTYHDFLTLLISEEIAHRQQTRLDRLVRRARFPFLKTIEDFNFTYQSIVRLALLGSALAPDFVTDGRCLILSGKPGRGKTHLAVAIAYRAIQNGFDARFVTAAELIDDLSAAFRSGRLADSLATYIHPGVLVIDEVGYLTYGTDAANMLFHVVNDRHRKKRAMIFTTNKPLTAWGRVLHDEDLAQAIVDRILERGRVLPLDGPSLRTKHLGLDDPTSSEALHQPARISGIDAPEFPEPTDGAPASSGRFECDWSSTHQAIKRTIGARRVTSSSASRASSRRSWRMGECSAWRRASAIRWRTTPSRIARGLPPERLCSSSTSLYQRGSADTSATVFMVLEGLSLVLALVMTFKAYRRDAK
jgi:DNA replication protein DnaC